MKIVLRILGALLGVLIALGIAQYVASESGEVAVLTTSDAAGESHETRVWIVDRDGTQWLRSGAEVQSWFVRLSAEPAVEVERAGSQHAYTATPLRAERGAINDLMREKYGWADQLIGALFGRDDSIPIRLDPSSE